MPFFSHLNSNYVELLGLRRRKLMRPLWRQPSNRRSEIHERHGGRNNIRTCLQGLHRHMPLLCRKAAGIRRLQLHGVQIYRLCPVFIRKAGQKGQVWRQTPVPGVYVCDGEGAHATSRRKSQRVSLILNKYQLPFGPQRIHNKTYATCHT